MNNLTGWVLGLFTLVIRLLAFCQIIKPETYLEMSLQKYALWINKIRCLEVCCIYRYLLLENPIVRPNTAITIFLRIPYKISTQLIECTILMH